MSPERSGVRLRDIGDARIELSEPVSQDLEAETARHRIAFPWLISGAALLLLFGILIGLFLMDGFWKPPPPSAVKSTIRFEAGHWLAGIMN